MKMKQVKRMLSITLAAAMLVTSVPVQSFASETTQTEQSETQGETSQSESAAPEVKVAQSESAAPEVKAAQSESAPPESKAAESKSAAAETKPEQSETAASETKTKAAQSESAASETKTEQSETAASEKKAEAAQSEGAASETKTEQSETAASETKMEQSETAASESQAEQSESTASETKTEQSETTAPEKKAEAAQSEGTASETKTEQSESTAPEANAAPKTQPAQSETAESEQTATEGKATAASESESKEGQEAAAETGSGADAGTAPTTKETGTGSESSGTDTGDTGSDGSGTGGTDAEGGTVDPTNPDQTEKIKGEISWSATSAEYKFGESLTPVPTFTYTEDGATKTLDKIEVTVKDSDGNDVRSITDVGTYTVTAAIPSDQADKFEITKGAELSFTVTAAVVTLDWTIGDVSASTYASKPVMWSDAGSEVKAVIKGKSVQFEYEIKKDATTTVTGNCKDTGSYKVTASIASTDPAYGNVNLESTSASINFDIKEKIELTWSPESATYTGTETTVTASFTPKSETSDSPVPLPLTVTKDGKEEKIKNAGTYMLSLALTDEQYKKFMFDENNAKTFAKEFKVAQCEKTVEWGNTTVDYTGDAQAPTATFEGEGSEGTINCAVTIKMKDGTDSGGESSKTHAGVYTASIDPSCYPNYDLDVTETDFTINPVERAIVWKNTGMTEDDTITYDGNAHAPTASFEGVKADGTVSYTVEITDANGTSEPESMKTNAGEYVAKVKNVNEHTDYILKTGSETSPFKITKCASTIQWSNLTTDYSGEPQCPTAQYFDEKRKWADCSVTLIKEGETTGSSTKTDAGTYTASVNPEDYPNFDLTSTEIQKTFTIKQYEAEIAWSDTVLTYNGQPQVPTAGFKGVKDTQVTCEVVFEDGEKAKTDAGVYEALVDETKHPNYKLTKTKETFTINPLEIAVAIPDVSVEYGYPDAVIDYTVTPAESSEMAKTELGDILQCDKGADAKAYEIKIKDGCIAAADSGFNLISMKDGIQKQNYHITERPTATYTVEPLKIVVTADPQSIIYGKTIPELTFVITRPEGSTAFPGDGVNGYITAEKAQEELTPAGEKLLVLADQTAAEVGNYEIILNPNVEKQEKYANYAITYVGDKLSIGKMTITVIAEKQSRFYKGSEEKNKYPFEVKIAKDVDTDMSPEQVKDDLGADFLTRKSGEDAGRYAYLINKKSTNYAKTERNYEITFEPDFEEVYYRIRKLPITLTPDSGQSKFYGESDPKPFTFGVQVNYEETPTLYTEEDIKKELKDVLVRATGKEAGEYKLSINEECEALANYNVTFTEGVTFKINRLPVDIIAVPDQHKVYGADDPSHIKYTVAIRDAGKATKKTLTEIKEELDEEFVQDVLERDAGEDVGEYSYHLDSLVADSTNYKLYYSAEALEVFTIDPLPVTVFPDAGQKKIFGQIEPELYTYTVSVDDADTLKTVEDVQTELGDYVIERAEGEAVGKYRYNIITADSPLYAYTNFGNFELSVADGAPTYKINPIVIESVEAINSRQDKFKVKTNLVGERQSGVTTKVKVEALEFPVSADGITFSEDIDTYIENASDGIVFKQDAKTVRINEASYERARKDNGENLQWKGYLPAGTTLRVSIVDGDGNTVSKKAKRVKVSQVAVTVNWTGAATGTDGSYVTADKKGANSLTLMSDRQGEQAEVLYSRDGGKKSAASYDALNMTFTPEVNNSGSTHVMQSVTGNVVDTLNLKCEPKTLKFYVDDTAFPIPAGSIQFENRGEKVVVKLPETGTVKSVTIPGGEVKISGESGKEFEFPVSWSGKKLIATGTAVSVEYTDQAGHVGNGSSTASRSTVSTPITFRIRPELNGSGYLNGRSSTLIVSGTACSCEPIRVTVAGNSQSTYATQKETWSDSNGSWEVMFSMASLPENQDFTISAEYTDVNGSGHSITAKFDAFCASPALTSPVFEAMTQISGMVEPGTAVALVINGDSQNYYEIQVDRFGHFMMDDVPTMFGGEDSFDIYVTDIAGNVSIRHYDIAEPGDPFEVSSSIHPLGRFFYTAEQSDSNVYVATPVSAADFDEEKKNVELPLLMGMTYEVGTLTLARTENGFTVTSEIQMDEEITSEDYLVENEKLYVYAGRPTLEELKNRTGEEYSFGAEIPLAEDQTVWIVAESDMTILAESIADLKVFDYEHSEEYVKYQEK